MSERNEPAPGVVDGAAVSGPFWAWSARDVVLVSGPDALSYLHSQVSQDLQPLAIGDSAWTLVLQPTGRIDALARVLRRSDEEVVLDVDAGHGDALVARLLRFKIRVKAEVSRLDWRCVAIRGADRSVIAGSDVEAGDAMVVVGWWADPALGVDLLGPDPAPPAGITEGSAADLEAARVVAGWPAMGAEITEATIPAESGLGEVAVSFTKGCYPGQELVERMDSRGAGAPRRLVTLAAPSGARAGDPLVIDGEEAGTFTSVAGQHAIASVRRSVPDTAIPGFRPR